jgi:tRNA U54 and U55 pseudouridine synthase Pus10
MAIRDKITIRMKSGGKPFVSEVKRPGGKVDVLVLQGTSLIQVRQLTRKDQVVDWAAFAADEIKSIEFERGG